MQCQKIDYYQFLIGNMPLLVVQLVVVLLDYRERVSEY